MMFVALQSPIGEKERARLMRDTAAKLQGAGLTAEAMHYYEEYLREPGLAPSIRASMAYLPLIF